MRRNTPPWLEEADDTMSDACFVLGRSADHAIQVHANETYELTGADGYAYRSVDGDLVGTIIIDVQRTIEDDGDLILLALHCRQVAESIEQHVRTMCDVKT